MKKPKIAVIIPTFTRNESLGKMATDNARIWKTQCDDLIISEDGGGYYRDLARVASLYLLHDQLGVAANANLAWKIALVRGADFVAITDSDVTWEKGFLKDLCIPGKIGVPVKDNIGPEKISVTIIAPMLVVPKEIATERGIYDDRGGFRMEGHDYDYYNVVSDLVVQIESCVISHIGSASRGVFENAFPWLKNDPSLYGVKV